MRVDAPEEVVQVDYLIESKEIGEDRERPFHFRIETTDYPEGVTVNVGTEWRRKSDDSRFDN